MPFCIRLIHWIIGIGVEPLDQSNANMKMDTRLRPVLHAFDPSRALDVRELRTRMGLTQRQFAGWFGFPVATLRHWERGNRTPAGTALVLLHVIRENPRIVLQAVRKARAKAPGSLAMIEELASYRAPPGFGERPVGR